MYDINMPYKDRQQYLAYQHRYNKEVRSKRPVWYKRSPESYTKYLASRRRAREKQKQAGTLVTGYQFYLRKRNEFIKSIGHCQICGYDVFEALIFHHPKSFNNRYARRYTAEGITKAIKNGNAVALCANCHILLHKGIISLPASLLPV